MDGSFSFEGVNMALLEEYEQDEYHVFEIRDDFNNRVCFRVLGKSIITVYNDVEA